MKDLNYYRDQAQNKDQYDDMVTVLSNAKSKEELDKIAMLYVLDMNYSRGDICLALNTIERKNSWGKYILDKENDKEES